MAQTDFCISTRWYQIWIFLGFLITHIITGKEISNPPTDAQIKDILMRDAKPRKHDQYLCTAYSVEDAEAYIYKFEALANASTAHHMILYGCDGEPWSKKPIWNCPLMCKTSASTIMFAWAKNAPPTVLPKGVGLRIGRATNLNTIVLQVHYAKKFEEEESPDRSGIRIHTTHEKQPFVAGILLLMSTWFTVPPKDPSYPVDISCQFHKDMTMVPFAYRTHAHGLGKVITGYKYANKTYTEIGRGNPQWPQAFYPVKDKIEIKKGDYVAARCTYDSTSMTHSVSVGATGDNEMCNFYIMFYTDSSVTFPYSQCMNNRVPSITGSNFPEDVSEPLPPNPALEEEATGHHHHGGMAGSPSTSDKEDSIEDGQSSSDDQQSSDGAVVDIPTPEQPPKGAGRKKENMNKTKLVLKQILRLDPSGSDLTKIYDSHKIQNQPSDTPGHKQEMMPPSYDFEDIDPRAISYEKRENHEYYEDYAANDLRERGLYGKPEDRGLSRNRHKEFEAMNQQIQKFPSQKAMVAGQHQQRYGGSYSQQKDGQKSPEAGTSPNGQRGGNPSQVKGSKVIQKAKPLINVLFEHNLVFNESWPTEPMHLGQVGGIATDKDGKVYIFHRGSRIWNAQSFSLDNDFMYQDSPINEDVLVILDRQGRLVRKLGAGQFFMPHGIEVDDDGNAWVTDVALHQVFKIPLATHLAKGKSSGNPEPTLVLGKRFKHGEDHDLFCKPSDVAVLSSGEFFVSDGYCNSRILKFSKEGKLIKIWGQRNINYKFPPPPGTFNLPHGVTVAEDSKLLFVADRENGRIQCFDLDGNFKYIIKHPEFGPRIYGVDYCSQHGGIIYAINGPGYDGRHPFDVQGFTLDIDTGQLLEMWNIPQASA
ncbi:peptidyl-glycine alpha-amidating monooxygenase [Plakobranchus ocellatus]|uniref:Peptidyl-glycine alpha-amidating monooxygenase n=1 Tax=Plakobranchus ocellatus TaxID=259542 RepID=A0AAV4DKI2_9GAST|nr:peptidyl-glycine alpha-amidating monooxygenase [Plakobranchus ocellatus]